MEEMSDLPLDRFLESALANEDTSVSIGLTLEGILDSIPLHSERDSLIDGATRLAAAFTDAVTRSARKLAAAHNLSAWPLPAELTTKVLLMLDTGSVCCAAATCKLFSKCASDPLCYANIDLIRSVAKVSNRVVSSMIQRAGNNLESIKLGRLPQDKKSDKSRLTWSCLYSLVLNGGAAGLLLRQLHLYNLDTQGYYLLSALSACQSLVELEIVGLDDNIELDTVLNICEHCHSIEHLCLDNRTISTPSRRPGNHPCCKNFTKT